MPTNPRQKTNTRPKQQREAGTQPTEAPSPRVIFRRHGTTAAYRHSAVAQALRDPPHAVIVPDALREAKEELIRDRGWLEGHVAARAVAAVQPDHRLGLENIVCVYIGEKMSAGRLTGDWAVKVQVLRKSGDPSRIEPQALIEPSIKVGSQRVLTDIEQVNQPPSAYQTPGAFGFAEDPATCGGSIGRQDGTTGTIGCLLVANNTLYLMSNNHVLSAANKGREGADAIFQPGLADAHSLSNARDIATLSKFVPLNLSQSQQVTVASSADVALAITNPDDCTFRHHKFTIAKDAMRFSAGSMVVKKEGRTTGFTVGRIVGFEADVVVGYGPPAFAGGPATPPFALFRNQLVIRSDTPPFSLPGDSGAVIVEHASNCIVALLFSGDNGATTYAHPIEDVLSALEGVGFAVEKFVTSEDDLK